MPRTTVRDYQQQTATVRNVTANGSETETAGIVFVNVDATSGAITRTLPTAVGNSAVFYFKKVDASANVVNVATTASQTIDGYASPLVINLKNTSRPIVSNGTNWYIY